MSDISKGLKDRYYKAKEDVSNLVLEDLIVLAAAALAGARMFDEDFTCEDCVNSTRRELEHS